MPIKPDQVRELVARGEGNLLDFKSDYYDPKKNGELAKDIMAIANNLRVGQHGYILIGVNENKVTKSGEIIGVDRSAHLDDAAHHQKVSSLLNHTPIFSYTPIDVEVDGKLQSVGVIEITGGGRPYFPLSDSGQSLKKHVAMYRNGTATETASPAMILEWVDEDDPAKARLRQLDLDAREAERKVRGKILLQNKSHTGTTMQIWLDLRNIGPRGFLVNNCRWRIEWRPSFFIAVAKSLDAKGAIQTEWIPWTEHRAPSGYITPNGLVPIPDVSYMPPDAGISRVIPFCWSREDALAHYNQYNVPIDELDFSWASFHFEIPARSELGGDDVLLTFVHPE